MTIEFKAYPKTPRLFRDIVVTQKLDGSNACCVIEIGNPSDSQEGYVAGIDISGVFYKVGAQSRKRVITPDQDNYGFATWVADNAEGLVKILGEGYHYGERWGSGINSGEGLAKGEKRFSLFNVNRWKDADLSSVPGLDVVPTLYEGVFSEEAINGCLDRLKSEGSVAVPGFMKPEGVVIFHTQSRQVYKVLCENDEIPKGLVDVEVS